MPDIIRIKNNHLLFTSSIEIDAIARPLKEHFDVTSFVYQKNFNDGSEIKFSNQPAWTKYFLEQGYYRVSGFEKHPSHYQSGFAAWAHLSHHQPILEEARRFNIANGLTLIQKTPDGCEFYFIGTTPDKLHVTNLLLNNIDFLKRFTFYFKEQAANLFKKADSERLIIPDKYKIVSSNEIGIPYKNNIVLNASNILKFKKVHFAKNIILSEREIACAKLLLQGKSARSIGEELFISPRTVETHLQHLKEKFHCHSKAELIKQLVDINLGSDSKELI